MPSINQAGGGCSCSSTPTVTCTPCNLPAADMTVSWNFSSSPGAWTGGATGSEPATYDMVAASWSGACHDSGSGSSSRRFLLSCSTGGAKLYASTYSYGGCHTILAGSTYGVSASSCSPAHLEFTLAGAFHGHVYFDA